MYISNPTSPVFLSTNNCRITNIFWNSFTVQTIFINSKTIFKFVTFPVSNTVARSQLSSQQATMKLVMKSGYKFKRFYSLSLTVQVSSSKIKFSIGGGIIPSATNVIQTIFGFVSNIFLRLSILMFVYFIFCG